MFAVRVNRHSGGAGQAWGRLPMLGGEVTGYAFGVDSLMIALGFSGHRHEVAQHTRGYTRWATQTETGGWCCGRQT